jgi:hypothetical protein
MMMITNTTTTPSASVPRDALEVSLTCFVMIMIDLNIVLVRSSMYANWCIANIRVDMSCSSGVALMIFVVAQH